MVTFAAPTENESSTQSILNSDCSPLTDVVLVGSGARREADSESNRVQLDTNLMKNLQTTATSITKLLRAIPAPVQMPVPFQRLRNLQRGWDGYDADPPSEALIRQGEGLWSVLSELHATKMPMVRAGADNFITFSWLENYPMEQLEVSIYENDDGTFRCDWHSLQHNDDNVPLQGESVTYPCAKLREFLAMSPILFR
ncbi:MAG: hypothetical protein SGJ27_27365 [Candidatus Melainabacteria bacterium]|nr:hypothetical protein [Candidatus Melainabacteria bacterium]